MMGGETKSNHSVIGELTMQHETRGNRPTYWPGRLVESETSVRKIEPLIWRGSSDLLALGQADGLIYFAADSHQHPEGEVVRFFPFD